MISFLAPSKQSIRQFRRAIATVIMLALNVSSIAALPAQRDEEGWTVFVPSSDSRIMYVSNDGDDLAGTFYAPSEVGGDPTAPTVGVNAFRTYAAAESHTREGYPDWILFRRGDVFSASISNPKSGRSGSELAIVGAYGTEGALPVVMPSDPSRNLIDNNGEWHHFAFTSIDFYSATRDPSSPLFSGTTGAGGFGILHRGTEYVSDITIEGCKFRFFKTSGIQSASRGFVTDITIRRTSFLDQYPESDIVIGFYANSIDGLLLEENVFDHVGWYSQGGTGGIGEASLYNHSTYIVDSHNVSLIRNISLRPSSIHHKFTGNSGELSATNILIENNLLVDGEIGFSIGGNVDGPRRFGNVEVRGNVITELGRSEPTDRGLAWGMDIIEWDTGIIEENLILRNTNPNVTNVHGIALVRGSIDVDITNNVIHDLRGDGITVDSEATGRSGINISGNQISEPNHAASYIISLGALAGTTFSSNAYASPALQFQISGYDSDLGEWRSQVESSVSSSVSFPDSNRSIEEYQASVSGSGGIQDFIDACRAQDRFSWDVTYTASMVNEWLREGFDISVGGGSSPSPPSGIRLQTP